MEQHHQLVQKTPQVLKRSLHSLVLSVDWFNQTVVSLKKNPQNNTLSSTASCVTSVQRINYFTYTWACRRCNHLGCRPGAVICARKAPSCSQDRAWTGDPGLQFCIATSRPGSSTGLLQASPSQGFWPCAGTATPSSVPNQP